ncbi:hypothetical protein BRD00_04405 [Halobacteriales archaeon QS_8_69_26]|nr:MAG: hypothetical protein BRD00_04405 [Halobacteriales archaeon QS_8_69_26]
MRAVNAATTALVGILVAAVLSVVDPVWPAAAIGAGALVSAGILLARPGGRKHYALAGIGYTLGLAAAIALSGWFPAEYGGSPLVSLVLFGLFGTFLVALKVAGGRVVRAVARRYGDAEYAQTVYDAVASVATLIGLAWTLLTIQEKAARYGGIGLGAVGTAALNYYGVEYAVVVWFLDSGVDVVVLLFVGFTLGLFHVLESLHTTWIATKKTASAGASKAEEAHARVAEARGEGDED